MFPRVPGKLVTCIQIFASRKAQWPIEATTLSLCTCCRQGDQTTGSRSGSTCPDTTSSHTTHLLTGCVGDHVEPEW